MFAKLKGFRVAGLFLLSLYPFNPLTPKPVFAQEPFYKGKTIRIIVGFAAGGGFDTYSRILARHMGKRIPGNPAIIVENMTGAGSLVAANHLYKVAKPDGLTIGNFIGGLFMLQVMGNPGIEFDARKFEYIGVPAREGRVCALTKASGITSMEKWMASRTPVKLGGVAPGTANDDIPKILKATLGLPIQLVSGYKGTSQIRLAAESGEVAGGCWGWDSVRATWRKGIESGEVVVVLQTMPQAHPDLPKVPLAFNFAKTEEARMLIQVGVHDPAAIVRPYTLPPGTPKDRVQMLRQAFMETLKEREFRAEIEKVNLEVNPATGEEVEKIIAGLFKLDSALVAKLKEILK